MRLLEALQNKKLKPEDLKYAVIADVNVKDKRTIEFTVMVKGEPYLWQLTFTWNIGE